MAAAGAQSSAYHLEFAKLWPWGPSCQLVPTYLTAAVNDARSIFEVRCTEKSGKHLAGCLAQGRSYYSLVATTLGGLGPPETLAWIDHIFLRSATREVAAGRRPYDAFSRRTHFYAALHAALIRSTADMLCRHTYFAPPTASAATASAVRRDRDRRDRQATQPTHQHP